MIVVTGAAGRLGRRVVQCLLERGYDVLGTDRVVYSNSPSPFVRVALCEAEQVAKLLDGVEAAIHIGGDSRPPSRGVWDVQEQCPEHIITSSGPQQIRACGVWYFLPVHLLWGDSGWASWRNRTDRVFETLFSISD